MKIALYSPYIPEHTGGGEAYLMRVASLLSTQHQVVVAVDQGSVDSTFLRKKYQEFTHFDISKVEFVASPLRTGSALAKLNWTRHFDVLYYVTDGSFFLSAARKNIVHIQIPFHHTMDTLSDRLKLANWPVRNTNSYFTKNVVSKAWRTNIQFVHQPAISMAEFGGTTAAKQPYILHVGRFFRQLHSKRQDIIVKLFAELIHQHPELKKNWKLHLVGGVEDAQYAEEVATLATGLPVEIHHHVSREELLDLYRHASIYWHATGFEVDPLQYPEKMEHFGISTVEAMAAGAVPVVYAQGGQPEILGDELAEFGWQTVESAVDITWQLIHSPAELHSAAAVAKKRADIFNGDRFAQILEEMLHA